MPIQLDTLLKDLNFVLPNISVSDIDLTKIMTLNLHDLEGQFQENLVLTSFFSMLEIEIRHRIQKRKNVQRDLENVLSKTALETVDTKLSDTKVKQFVERDDTWKRLRDELSELEYQVNTVKSVVADLNRKGIALNVLTAKARTELGAAVTHN